MATQKKGEPTSLQYVGALEAARERLGQTETAFGYIHFSDPGFLRRMRKGVTLKKKTIERIQNLLREVAPTRRVAGQPVDQPRAD